MSLYGKPTSFPNTGPSHSAKPVEPQVGSLPLESLCRIWFLYVFFCMIIDEASYLYSAYNGVAKYFIQFVGGLYWAQVATSVVFTALWCWVAFSLSRKSNKVLAILYLVGVVIMAAGIAVRTNIPHVFADPAENAAYTFSWNWLWAASRAPLRVLAWISATLNFAGVSSKVQFLFTPIFVYIQGAIAFGMGVFALVARKPAGSAGG